MQHDFQVGVRSGHKLPGSPKAIRGTLQSTAGEKKGKYTASLGMGCATGSVTSLSLHFFICKGEIKMPTLLKVSQPLQSGSERKWQHMHGTLRYGDSSLTPGTTSPGPYFPRLPQGCPQGWWEPHHSTPVTPHDLPWLGRSDVGIKWHELKVVRILVAKRIYDQLSSCGSAWNHLGT